MTDHTSRTDYEVVVVGGGAAGLSAGLMLARARRSVVVVDAGRPRNAVAHGVHGLLGRDGMPPEELLGLGRSEVRNYGGEVVRGEVVSLTGQSGQFEAKLADASVITASRVLVTTGLVDQLPDVAGLSGRWGREVVHCPYCHGWEVRDSAIVVLASGPMSVHQALLFRQWSARITLLTHTIEPLSDADCEQLAARDIRVVPGQAQSLEIVDDRVTGVRLADGKVVGCETVVVAPRMVASAGLLASVGLTPVEHPSGMGQYVPADPSGRSEVDGVWLAGNVSDLSAQVGGAAAAAAWAAAQINADLLLEENARALAAHRAAGASAPGES